MQKIEITRKPLRSGLFGGHCGCCTKSNMGQEHHSSKPSTNIRQIMVSPSGHEIYLYKPELVVRSIAAVIRAAKDHSRLASID